MTTAQREILTALLTTEGWTDCDIYRGCHGMAKPRLHWQAYVGKRRVSHRTLDVLVRCGLVRRYSLDGVGRFAITDAGRAALT